MVLYLKKARKGIALFMAVVITFASIAIAPTATAPAAESALTSFDTSTAITSIKYDFNITNATIGRSVTFRMMDSNWVEHSQSFQLTGDGAYSVNFNLSNATGIINMGFFVTDTNNTAVATLSKVTLNGTYALTYNATLKVNSTWENSLQNIWSGLTNGQKIAQSSNAYIAYTTGTSNLLIFYIVYSPVATTIQTIKYDFNITNATNGSSLTFKMMDSSWTEHSKTLQLSGNGTYSFNFKLANASGIINMGYFVTNTSSSAVATLTKVTINRKYELSYPATLKINSTWENSLKNIWSGLTDGAKVAQAANGYIAFTTSNNLLTLYTAAISTPLLSIKYDFNITNATNGSSITFKMKDSKWVDHSQTLQLTGDGAYSVSFLIGTASGIIDMGYFVTDTNSTAVATLNKVTVNKKYELTYNATLKVNSTWENSLKNVWQGLTDGEVIAQGTNSYIAYTVGTSNLLIFYAAALTSQAYVEAMGNGFNVFNSFDSINDQDFSQSTETSWGQPVVTQDYILQARDKGFDNIRIPMTAYTRYTLGADGHYVINAAWLTRYKEVVDWAVDAGFYVMVNLHHDSWTWLENWDGNTASVEYQRFVDLWTQLANYFKDEPNTVYFETINEPIFVEDTGSITKQDKLDMVNQTALNIIRNSGGNNASRMVVIPTYVTSSDVASTNATYNSIVAMNDPNLIATVHFYTDWVFSVNMGITSFDEPLSSGSTDTARSHIDLLFNTLYDSFVSKGIGTIIGEYGWLSDNDGPAAMQPGEKIKYFEYLNFKARQNGVCPIIWPGAFGRVTPYNWDTLFGPTLKAANEGQRSSYATGLNELYFSQTVTNGVQIPLTLNGNTFTGITGLTEGTDYTYNASTATVTLTSTYVNNKYNAMGSNVYGTMADLVIKFSKGADWHQYLIKNATPVFQTATGSTAYDLNIPVAFKGSKIRRAAAFNAAGNRIGPTAWFTYDKFGSAFTADYTNNTFVIKSSFLTDSSMLDGTFKFKIEFYDGQIINYQLQKSGTTVTGIGVVN